jgi:hypothetical protein
MIRRKEIQSQANAGSCLREYTPVIILLISFSWIHYCRISLAARAQSNFILQTTKMNELQQQIAKHLLKYFQDLEPVPEYLIS